MPVSPIDPTELRFDSFEWDEAKSISNRQKHDISFETAAAIFDNLVITREDDRKDYGEPRFIALGMVQGRCLTVVYTPRPDRVCRIISAWKAGAHERAHYAKVVERHQAQP
ncbi:BrnT family toxin [uncultured Rhodospira sp.]|uniref:BrnT family toxin n=1 Tax=uncultured Rhodospira sp. TaxID=1936189 RepID=UPI0026326DA1|nr:BrnT family toxin [uncultured Rhodospira sp.]